MRRRCFMCGNSTNGTCVIINVILKSKYCINCIDFIDDVRYNIGVASRFIQSHKALSFDTYYEF
jgi:hypothetical protein